MHLIINVIGSVKHGTGHVYRMLRLTSKCRSSATALEHKCKSIQHTFVVQKNERLCIEILTEHDIVPFVYDSIDNLDVLLSSIQRADVIINDCLNTDVCLMTCARKYSDKIINFEDYGEGSKNADLVINSFYTEHVLRGTNVYVGLEYTLISKLLLESSPCEFNRVVNRLVLTFGGSDPSNITQTVLELLIKENIHVHIEILVILGIGYLNAATIQRISKPYKNIRVVINEKNMIGQMQKSDIAITSCGTAMYEACYLLLPVICIAHHQREMMHTELCLQNTILNLGCFDDFSSESFTTYLHKLNNDPAQRLAIRTNMKTMRDMMSKSFENVIGLVYDKCV